MLCKAAKAMRIFDGSLADFRANGLPALQAEFNHAWLDIANRRMKRWTPNIEWKDERPTSNIERPTSNETPNIELLFLFLFSRFDTRNKNFNQFFCFL